MCFKFACLSTIIIFLPPFVINRIGYRSGFYSEDLHDLHGLQTLLLHLHSVCSIHGHFSVHDKPPFSMHNFLHFILLQWIPSSTGTWNPTHIGLICKAANKQLPNKQLPYFIYIVVIEQCSFWTEQNRKQPPGFAVWSTSNRVYSRFLLFIRWKYNAE